MGASESCCNRPCAQPTVVKMSKAESAGSGEHFGCVEHCHVEALLASLPDEELGEILSRSFHDRCSAIFTAVKHSGSGFLQGEELAEAVRLLMPQEYIHRLHAVNIDGLALAFDESQDGRINCEEFSSFCAWVAAMRYHGFFEGSGPLAQILKTDVDKNTSHQYLLLVSEFLDPNRILQGCVLPPVLCVYYHPDKLTMDELTAQLESAAYARAKRHRPFKSVALANHGPSEEGYWYVCADAPVSMKSTDAAWPKLMPLFRALADMVVCPKGTGRVDLLACEFAARPAGVECLEMIEKATHVKFAASTDATGNVAQGGNWELEVGNRNVAAIYFDEKRLQDFNSLMKLGLGIPPKKARRPNHRLDDVFMAADGPQYRTLLTKRKEEPARLRNPRGAKAPEKMKEDDAPIEHCPRPSKAQEAEELSPMEQALTEEIERKASAKAQKDRERPNWDDEFM